MTKKPIPLAKVYEFLEPAPVIMVTTSRKGTPNVMTMSWYMMVDFTPPLVACVMGQEDYSFGVLQETRECVINIPTVELAEKLVGVGSTTGQKIDKFKKFKLATQPATQVEAPLLTDCYANFECRVVNTVLAKKYNIFILQVVQAWITPSRKRRRTLHHCGNGLFTIDGKTIKLPFKSISR